VDVINYEPNEIHLRVTAQRRAVLVATETFWDEWNATEDGGSVPLVRADGLFRAVPVSAGTHEIRMRIVPRSMYLGAAISLASLILCLIWLGFGGASESRTASRPPESEWAEYSASAEAGRRTSDHRRIED
jgi:uncharacterized membrane protein YfhO